MFDESCRMWPHCWKIEFLTQVINTSHRKMQAGRKHSDPYISFEVIWFSVERAPSDSTLCTQKYVVHDFTFGETIINKSAAYDKCSVLPLGLKVILVGPRFMQRLELVLLHSVNWLNRLSVGMVAPHEIPHQKQNIEWKCWWKIAEVRLLSLVLVYALDLVRLMCYSIRWCVLVRQSQKWSNTNETVVALCNLMRND